MKKTVLIVLAIILLMPIGYILFSDYKHLFYIRAKKDFIEFTEFSNTPGHLEEYPSQGITRIGSKLVLNNHHMDRESWVYEIDSETGVIQRSFIMPLKAKHVGGLCWDGTYLYAVDYVTNRVYQMEYDNSFNSGEAVVIKSFDTTLEGASACGYIEDEDNNLIIISDFKNSKRTIVVDLNKALIEGSARESILYSYKNESFSQGLCYYNGVIYEVENKLYKSVVNLYDFKTIKDGGDAKEAFINQYFLPDRGGQDIIIEDDEVYISDSVSFKIYRGDLGKSF